MFASWTLSRYIGRQFFFAFLAAFLVFLAIVFLADFVELLRRTANREEVTLANVITMTLLRLPNLGSQLLPFAILIGAMASLLRLSRTSELVVTRAAGLSVWQFLTPALAVAFLVGIFTVTIYNPVSATLITRFEQLEARYIKGRASLLSVAETGLWLQEATEEGKTVVHALRGSQAGKIELREVMIFQFAQDDTFLSRIDAEEAVLEPGHWHLTGAQVTPANTPGKYFETYQVPTFLEMSQVQESFMDPSTISFWDLPKFIAAADKAGFSVLPHRIHWHSLISTPFLLCTMVIVAAIFSLRISRLGGLGQLVLGAIFSGFVFFFFTRLSLALGSSGIIPPFLAAWAPAIFTALVGLAVLFHLEDG